MKNIMKRTLALLIAVVSVCALFTACDSGKKEKAKVTVEIYDLKGDIFLKVVDMEIEDGTTASAAVEALCTLREATFTKDLNGEFDSFTFDGTTVAVKQENLPNGNVKMYTVAWKLGDAVQKNADGSNIKMNDVVLENGAKVVVIFESKEVEPAKN